MARRRPAKVHGLLVVDKPAGVTSHDVVSMARKTLGERKIGHSGTLDPDATGVILLGVGNATRLLRFITMLPKTYETQIVFGASTSTLDDSGEVVERFEMGGLAPSTVMAEATKLTGDIMQIPPMVSALKVEGKRLHELAREGVEVEREARLVTVHRFDVIPTTDPLVWNAEIECGSGTYVRSLAADLGSALGGGAHIRSLRRTKSGSFTGAEATSVDAFDLRPMADVMRDHARLAVDADTVAKLRNGEFLPTDPGGDGPWAVFSESGELVAVHERDDHGRVRPGVVIPSTV